MRRIFFGLQVGYERCYGLAFLGHLQESDLHFYNYSTSVDKSYSNLRARRYSSLYIHVKHSKYMTQIVNLPHILFFLY